MSNNSSSSSGGIGILGLLGVAFVVLKLCDVIDWSWWWVTAPFWGLFALLAAVAIIAAALWVICYSVGLVVGEFARRKRTRELAEQA